MNRRSFISQLLLALALPFFAMFAKPRLANDCPFPSWDDAGRHSPVNPEEVRRLCEEMLWGDDAFAAHNKKFAT